jgi:hypothetical protein
MKKVKHYFITLTLNSGIHLNSYLITDDDALVEKITSMLLNKADELKEDYLPIVLVTNLGTRVKIVQDYLREYAPETRQWLDIATNFHHTMWAMSKDDPAAERLMALH